MSKRRFVVLAGLLPLAAIVLLAGCGEAGPATLVKGKVTLNGEPVNGTIHFVGADGKEVSSPVGPGDGQYQIANPPTGEVTVLVKGSSAPDVAALPKAPGAMEMPGMSKAGGGAAGVAPPAKYAEAAGGLKYTVVTGTQTKNFELTP